jgi:hypothetical protein
VNAISTIELGRVDALHDVTRACVLLRVAQQPLHALHCAAKINAADDDFIMMANPDTQIAMWQAV